MFDRLFRRAERKIDSVVAKYVRRIIVAVPLLIAAVFATAALTVKMVELYGTLYGYAAMAGGFTVLSGVLALFALTGQRTPVEEAEAAAGETADKVKDADDQPVVPPELLSVMTAAAPVALPGLARAAARNLPLLIILAIIGYLFARYVSRSSSAEEAAEDAADAAADAADAATDAHAASRRTTNGATAASAAAA